MKRREVLKSAAAFAAANLFTMNLNAALPEPLTSALSLANSPQQKTYDAALAVLAGNVKPVPRYDHPVLFEGAVYPGIWLECGPHEGYVYRHINPAAARHNHLAFFALQRPDGQLPASIKLSEAGYGQIQMTVPIAATAWETARETNDSELLEKAYAACSRWDAWLVRFRNTRNTGLIEGFCTYDTGHDNSPRWAGIPNRCPDADAKKFPPLPGMPRLCPDLSATVYGGRIALAAMAAALHKPDEQSHWLQQADTIRSLILSKLYSPEDACFYDLDADNKFIRIRGDLLTRVLGEHVVPQALFDTIWQRQIHNPHAFWAPFPLPSIALDDPAFVRPIPRNSWGGATQALTALRAPRWFEHYNRPADLAHMMLRWTEAISRSIEFRQQMDPLTGDFTRIDPSGYSPAALVFLDYTWRLGGPRIEAASSYLADTPHNGDHIEWNIRPAAFAPGARFTRTLKSGTATITYLPETTELKLNGKPLTSVQGTARILSDHSGKFLAVIGFDESRQTIKFTHPSGHHREHTLAPNERILI